MARFSTALLTAVVVLAHPGDSWAQLQTITDTTSTGATLDGSINGGEYTGQLSGINAGFGDLIGAGSVMHIDSDDADHLYIGFESGGASLDDFIVIYFDSIPGGYSDTTAFGDLSDPYRSAISGFDGSSRNDLAFAPGFTADFAIALDANGGSLYALSDTGHTFLDDVGLIPVADPTAAGWELQVSLSSLGLAPGGTVGFVATLIDTATMTRADELIGVAGASVPAGNIASGTTTTLQTDDYAAFVAFLTAFCGDGSVDAGEVCDDGGGDDGDGCSGDCSTEEAGWRCPLAGGACSEICNDLMVVGDEICDDGNNDNDDGCTADCRGIEGGWECPPTGGACIALPACPDCLVLIADNFDDDNLDASLWSIDTTNPSSAGSETGQHIELQSAAWLVTAQELAPVASGGLDIQATWIVGAGDEVWVLTRSDLTLGDEGRPATALEFGASEASDLVYLNTPAGPDSTALTISAGDELDFAITDDGVDALLIVTNVTTGVSAAGLAVTYPNAHAVNYVVFTNRANDGSDYTSSLDDVRISTLNDFPCHSVGCDGDTLTCGVTFAPIFSACDDGDPATVNDACTNVGTCLGVGPNCGNGTVDAGEQCDNGASNSNTTANACRTNCRRAFCGDDVRDNNEACDDGSANGNVADACRLNCRLPRCGDLILDSAEGCDDGNTRSDDGCAADCSGVEPGWDCSAVPCVTICGDGQSAGVEQCDDGAGNSDTIPDACRTDCRDPRCGDGVTDPHAADPAPAEQCDHGLANSDILRDACRTDCRTARCGDGVVDTGEVCDDLNTLAGDGCAATCHTVEAGWTCTTTPCSSICGDGVLVGDEACDNGDDNGNEPDACRNDCTNPRCGDGVRDTGEPCDDGNESNNDGCLAGCVEPTCGDGFVFSVFEQCDAGGNNSDTEPDRCRTDCTRPLCGDGIVDSNEECDDGNGDNFDGCSSLCWVDTDGDDIRDDGDGSGDANDAPCRSGATVDCDDNCVNAANADQADEDQDGVGDACDPDQLTVTEDGGCSCSSSGPDPSLAGLVVLGAFVLRRRRRTERA